MRKLLRLIRKIEQEYMRLMCFLMRLILGDLIFFAMQKWRCGVCNYPLSRENKRCPNCWHEIAWTKCKKEKQKWRTKP